MQGPSFPSVTADDTPPPKRAHVDPGSDIPRQTIDYSLRLPQGWKNITQGDRSWIGRALFVAKGKLSPNLKLWWHPPPCEVSALKPVSEAYHRKRLLLWMPRRMWNVNFMCPNCDTPQSLRSKGIYKHVRIVMDFTNFYYLAGEYMDCRGCNASFISWDRRILDQLTDGVRARFPVVLTFKYACDQSVIALMRSRTLGKIIMIIGQLHSLFQYSGNSSTAMRNTLHEIHSEEWLKRQLAYLTDCQRHMKGLQKLQQPPVTYAETMSFPAFPTAK